MWPFRRPDHRDTVLQNEGPEPGRPHHPGLLNHMQGIIAQFGELVYAAVRPLPTQTGDGSYLEEPESENWYKDITSLDSKDLGTIKDMSVHVVDPEPVDDKKYYQERLVNVSANSSATRSTLM